MLWIIVILVLYQIVWIVPKCLYTHCTIQIVHRLLPLQIYLNSLIMQVQIRIYSGVQNMIDNNHLFERIVDIHNDVRPPFESLVDSLKFMYGSSCIVQLNFQ